MLDLCGTIQAAMTRNESKSVELQASNGTKFLIEEDDLHLVEPYNWHIDRSGYIYRHRWFDGKDKPLRLHRVIVNAPQGMDVDHVNKVRHDNRRSNLRVCTRQQNIFNSKRRSNNTTGYKGVTVKRGKYRARIRIGGKEIVLGHFQTAKEAGDAYDKAAIQHHKEFAYL